MTEFELELIKNLDDFKKYSLFACDEVGRGPLAGPVVGACTYLNLGQFKTVKELEQWLGKLRSLKITDSKKLSAQKRQNIISTLLEQNSKTTSKHEFSYEVFGVSVKTFIAEVDHVTIDQINILNASLKSMFLGYEKLGNKNKNEIVLIDGNKVFKESVLGELLPVVKGDQKSCLIALSSIFAKEYRDDLMKKFSEIYPEYDFAKNAGYPSLKHRNAIKNVGPSPIHRKTFRGVKEYV